MGWIRQKLQYLWDTWYLPVPEIAWLQVEVTTSCNAGCTYCPRTAAGRAWRNTDLDPALLQRLKPLFPHIPYVHLQGWGEPLLHPDFFALAEMVVRSGSRCGTTTNGVLVDDRMADRLVRSGLDVVGFSLCGSGPGHDRFRSGAPLEKVLTGMKNLAAARQQAGQRKPFLHIAYMLLADGIGELTELPALLQGLPVEQVVISTLDCVPDPSLSVQVVRNGTPQAALALQHIAQAGEIFAGRGTRISCRLRNHAAGPELRSCTEQADQTLVLAADGRIFPCVFANLPAAAESGGLCFGSLQDSSLQRIWHSDAYRRFRRSFRTGEVAAGCRECPKRTG